jgi:hypothetical protein
VPHNTRLLLSGRERLSRREVCLIELVCGGFGTPRSRSAGRSAAPERCAVPLMLVARRWDPPCRPLPSAAPRRRLNQERTP